MLPLTVGEGVGLAHAEVVIVQPIDEAAVQACGDTKNLPSFYTTWPITTVPTH
jgi:hypothetical protein